MGHANPSNNPLLNERARKRFTLTDFFLVLNKVREKVFCFTIFKLDKNCKLKKNSFMLRKAIPHLFTSLNLLCGCLATFFAFSHQFNAALMFVALGVFFDFFDGFFARLLGEESSLGVQLDSLADLISSGLAPGVLMYQLFVLSGVKNIDFSFTLIPDFAFVFTVAPLAIIGYSITVGAAFRLAKFNLITDPLPYFRGLPAPANALMIMGLPMIFRHPYLVQLNDYLMNPISLTVCCFISVILMNIHWKMFSLKFSGGMMSLLFPVLLLMIATVLFIYFGIASLSGIIVIYILLSSIKFFFKI